MNNTRVKRVKTSLPQEDDLTTKNLYKGLIFAALIIRDYNEYADIQELKEKANTLANILLEK